MFGVSLQEYMVYWVGLIIITIGVVIVFIFNLLKSFIQSLMKRRRD